MVLLGGVSEMSAEEKVKMCVESRLFAGSLVCSEYTVFIKIHYFLDITRPIESLAHPVSVVVKLE